METRYILPATVAASLHLIAFFGFSPTPKPPPPPPGPSTVVCGFDRMAVPPEDPPEPVDATAVPAEPAKGSPDALRPDLDDPLRNPPDGAFTLVPEPPHRIGTATLAKPDLPGLPGGIEGGTGNAPIVNFNGLDNPPRARARVAPGYPSELRAAGIAGEVLVGFVVEEDGRVSWVRVLRATDSRFEAATVRAVERWRFEPGKKNGRPVRFRMEVPIVFNLAN